MIRLLHLKNPAVVVCFNMRCGRGDQLVQRVSLNEDFATGNPSRPVPV